MQKTMIVNNRFRRSHSVYNSGQHLLHAIDNILGLTPSRGPYQYGIWTFFYYLKPEYLLRADLWEDLNVAPESAMPTS